MRNIYKCPMEKVKKNEINREICVIICVANKQAKTNHKS